MVEGEEYVVEAAAALRSTTLMHYLHWRGEARRVVVLNPGQTVGSAMQLFAMHRIISAPVIDEADLPGKPVPTH
jgi:CBS domain-containing protein